MPRVEKEWMGLVPNSAQRADCVDTVHSIDNMTAHHSAQQRHADAVDRFAELAAVGVLGKVWPRERAATALRVCKWMRHALLEHVEQVALTLRAEHNASASDIEGMAKLLWWLRDHELFLSHSTSIRTSASVMLRVLSHATEQGFGHKLVHLNLSSRAAMQRTDALFGQVHVRRIENTDLATLASVLQHCAQLTHLDLSCNGISWEGLGSLLNTCSALTHLDLGHNTLGYRAAESLGHALSGCSALRHLSVRDNGMRPGAVAYLVRRLGACEQLATLDVSANTLGYEGLVGIVEALGSCAALRSLDLSRSSIPQEAAELLEDLVRDLPSLQRLDLSYSFLQDEGVELVAGAISSGHRLEWLGLEQCALADPAASSLAQAVGRSAALAGLQVSFNRIGDPGAAALLHALLLRPRARSPRPRSLDLSHNALSPSVRAQLAATAAAHRVTLLLDPLPPSPHPHPPLSWPPLQPPSSERWHTGSEGQAP